MHDTSYVGPILLHLRSYDMLEVKEYDEQRGLGRSRSSTANNAALTHLNPSKPSLEDSKQMEGYALYT